MAAHDYDGNGGGGELTHMIRSCSSRAYHDDDDDGGDDDGDERSYQFLFLSRRGSF